MVIKDLDRLKELEERCGNKYLAVMFIAKASRKLGKEQSIYHIAESKLIQWVLSGKCPYTEAQLEQRKFIAEDDGLSEILGWVMDEEVVHAVTSQYKKSVRNRHLMYYEDSTMPSAKQDRVNVLLRMAWYTALV